MLFCNSLTDCKTNPGSGVFVSRVQALENLKNSISILLIDTNPVVRNGKDPVVHILLCLYVNIRDNAGFVEFDCIADQVLEHLGDLFPICIN